MARSNPHSLSQRWRQSHDLSFPASAAAAHHKMRRCTHAVAAAAAEDAAKVRTKPWRLK